MAKNGNILGNRQVLTNFEKSNFFAPHGGSRQVKIQKLCPFFKFQLKSHFLKDSFFRNNSTPVCPIDPIFGYVTPWGMQKQKWC